MQARTSAYWTALTSAVATWRYGLDILASDEATLLESATYDQNASDRLIAQSGQIDLDMTAKAARAFKLTLRSSDGRYLPGPAGFPSGGAGSPTATGLTWYNVRYRPWIDLRTGFDSKGNEVYERTYLGVFILANPEVDVVVSGATVALTLVDKSALLQKPFQYLASNIHTYSKGGHTVAGYAKGSTFDSVMTDLAVRAGIPANRIYFEPSSLTLPADFQVVEGDEPWTDLQILAGSMAHVMYFDHMGNLVRRASPLYLNTPSAYLFAPGPTSIISTIKRTVDLSNVYNHVIVIGASTKGAIVRGEAQVTNPASPYHKSQIGERICFVGKDGKLNDTTPDPTINTTGQAQTRAQVILAQHVGRQETIDITTRNIPPLEPYDRITVAVPQSGLSMDFICDKISWKLAHEGMEVTASRWVPVGS